MEFLSSVWRGGRGRLRRPAPSALVALAACATLAGCGADVRGEQDRGAAASAEESTAGLRELQELPPGVTPGMVARGEEVFAGDGICYNCHGPAGRGIPQLGADLTDDAWVHVDGSYESLVRIVREGVLSETSSSGMPMPPRGGARLSDEDVRAVAAYVWTLSR